MTKTGTHPDGQKGHIKKVNTFSCEYGVCVEGAVPL